MNYIKKLLSEKEPASSKRALGLAMSFFLIIASFVLLFKRTPVANPILVDRILLYDLLIVLMSLFGLAIDTVGKIMLLVSKTQAAAAILTPQPTVTKVDNVEGDVNGTVPTTGNETQVGDEVFESTEEDMKKLRKNLTNSLTEE